MNILHISCSPRGQASESHRLAQKIIESLLANEPESTVHMRILGSGSIPHVDASYAVAQHSPGTLVPQERSILLSDELIRELEQADVLVIGTPMHNLSIPSALKAWIDHVVRARRTFNISRGRKTGALQDRPVYIAVASGGIYSGERGGQPDFLTPYLQTILATIGLRDLTFFSVQGTGLGPEAVTQARTRAEATVREHFSQLLARG
jgi:FMN-dependent NADH-azoreductase